MVARLPQPVTVSELAQFLGVPVEGDADHRVDRLASLESADESSIGFLSARKHLPSAQGARFGALIVGRQLADQLSGSCHARLISQDPYADYARLSAWFANRLRPAAPFTGIHPQAVVHAGAALDAGVSVGPATVVDSGVRIGRASRIASGCAIGPGVEIGEDCVLHPGVVIYAGVRIGARVIIHAGTVIGADGFGFAPSRTGWIKIEQLGSVRIGDDVEIGAGCTIDRGALDDTVIGTGVKIDNQVQVGHNVQIGEHTVIAGCVGIAGSAVIGARCMIGGGVGVAGHLQICDGAIIGGFSLVERSVTEPGFYTGAWPLQGHAEWERTAATLKQLPRMRQRLRALEASNSSDSSSTFLSPSSSDSSSSSVSSSKDPQA